MFDRWVVTEGLGYWSLADPARWICTAALARYFGLPGGLDALSVRLDLVEKKGDYGATEGINLFTKRYSSKFRTPEQEPEKWQKFMAYGDQDIRTTRSTYIQLGRRLPGRAARHWKEREHKVFLWDQRVNELGIPVDLNVLDSALTMVAVMKPRMERELAELTRGEITKLGSPKLRDYLRTEFWMQLANLRRDETLMPLLEEGDLDPRARAIIELRVHGHRSSLAKFGRMETMVSDDQRIRAAFLYHGAHTGRWAGQGFQPQNMTRPAEGLDPVEVGDAIVRFHADPDRLAEHFGRPIYEILVAGLRGAIHAKPGKVLVIGDYNQIESRLTAYFADCQRKLEAFRKHDAGESNLDPYEITALDVLGDSSRRHEGKTMDLGLGFGMGDLKFSRVAGVEYPTAKRWVHRWRQTYEEIPQLWYGTAEAFRSAIRLGRGTYVDTEVERDRETKLGVMWLPSGKPLFYHTLRFASWAETLMQAAMYGRLDEAKARMVSARLDPENPNNRKLANTFQLAYQGVYGNHRFIHGGLTVENKVQGSAREVMMQHALEIEEERNLVPVLHSHDELVFEVDEGEADEFAEYLTWKMSCSPWWAFDLPLKAKVKLSERYTK